ncbi:MarR family winged helix-turn-helix transcriptional regulator [Bifidobacterium eulemuris]|uniref:MarR family transcriptional regulator n=1 Tax=Bifidobacterium eulemuris TaxID=1765219 RepID=A0A261G1J7_9BIFI|nr:MarR family transcriptional regulator [Bifidobacterium eulemuris]OZG65043.1 MarR family transcriptional regulator [Bifidobacterium eulemuris]QOL32860.1 MarR family transcriptional regulator [Bifidobacterium eulemuris]
MTDDCDSNRIPLGVAVRSLNNMIARYVAVTSSQDRCEVTGVNADIIVFLAQHQDRDVFPQDLERRFSTTRSTVSRVLGLMESKGLVERRPVERDARCKSIVLTDKAKAIAESMRQHGDAMERMLLRGMDDEEVAALRRSLHTMRDNLIATGKVGKDDKECMDDTTMEGKDRV